MSAKSLIGGSSATSSLATSGQKTCVSSWYETTVRICDISSGTPHDLYFLGSVQEIDGIPSDLTSIYKTAWELSQKAIIDLAAERGPFICQSQSTSIYIDQPTYKKLVPNALSLFRFA